jgi:hypothetical protein
MNLYDEAYEMWCVMGEEYNESTGFCIKKIATISVFIGPCLIVAHACGFL